MFYDAFFPDPNTQVPWVKESKTLPYIKGAGDSIRYMIEAYMPSSLTAPPGEQPQDEQPPGQQQGALENPRSDELALEVPGRYHICVTWRVSAG
jgi:membrane protein required for colicin V production